MRRPCSSRWGLLAEVEVREALLKQVRVTMAGWVAHLHLRHTGFGFLMRNMSPEAPRDCLWGKAPDLCPSNALGFMRGMLQQHNPEACAVAKGSAQHSVFGWMGRPLTPLLSQAATCVDCMAHACRHLSSLLPAGPAGHLNLLRPGALCQWCTVGGSQRWPPHAAPKHELSDDARTAQLCWPYRCPAAQHEGSDTPSRPSPCSRCPWG